MSQFNVKSAIKHVTQALKKANLHYGHGTDNPSDEAYALVLQALNLPFSIDQEELSRKLTDEEEAQIQTWVQTRIEKRLPLAYLTHEAYFFGIPFYVDERVIIPRSSIGELIEQQFTPWADPEKVLRILDLCTGSGCLAIACAYAFEYAAVDAVDISHDALEVAKINVDKHEMHNQVNLFQSDLFEAVKGKRYDVIVSNPPYVPEEEMKTLPKEYLHEPELALYSDDEGLALTIRILKEAPQYLTPNGILIVEVGNSWEALQERFPDVPFMWLEFENGEGGVFLLTMEQLQQCQAIFR